MTPVSFRCQIVFQKIFAALGAYFCTGCEKIWFYDFWCDEAPSTFWQSLEARLAAYQQEFGIRRQNKIFSQVCCQPLNSNVNIEILWLRKSYENGVISCLINVLADQFLLSAEQCKYRASDLANAVKTSTGNEFLDVT